MYHFLHLEKKHQIICIRKMNIFCCWIAYIFRGSEIGQEFVICIMWTSIKTKTFKYASALIVQSPWQFSVSYSWPWIIGGRVNQQFNGHCWSKSSHTLFFFFLCYILYFSSPYISHTSFSMLILNPFQPWIKHVQ